MLNHKVQMKQQMWIVHEINNKKYVHGSCDQGEGFSRKLKHNNNNNKPNTIPFGQKR